MSCYFIWFMWFSFLLELRGSSAEACTILQVVLRSSGWKCSGKTSVPQTFHGSLCVSMLFGSRTSPNPCLCVARQQFIRKVPGIWINVSYSVAESTWVLRGSSAEANLSVRNSDMRPRKQLCSDKHLVEAPRKQKYGTSKSPLQQYIYIYIYICICIKWIPFCTTAYEGQKLIIGPFAPSRFL